MDKEIDESEWHWDDEDWNKKEKMTKDGFHERANTSKEGKVNKITIDDIEESDNQEYWANKWTKNKKIYSEKEAKDSREWEKKQKKLAAERYELKQESDRIMKQQQEEMHSNYYHEREVKETSNNQYFPLWKLIAIGLLLFAGPIGWFIGTLIIFMRTNNSTNKTFAAMNLSKALNLFSKELFK